VLLGALLLQGAMPLYADPIISLPGAAELLAAARELRQGEEVPVEVRFTVPLIGAGRAQVTFHSVTAPSTTISPDATVVYRLNGSALVLNRGSARKAGRTRLIPLGGSLILAPDGSGKIVLLPSPEGLSARNAYHRIEIDLSTGEFRSGRAPELLLHRPCGAMHERSAVARSSGTVARATNGYRVTLSTDAAGDFFSRFGASSNTEVSVLVNQASAVYENQLGVRIDLVDQNVHLTSSPFPGTDTDPVSVLQSFGGYFYANQHLVPADAYMLFVRRDLDDSTLGIAYIQAICNSLIEPAGPFSLISYVNRAVTWVTVAHELGHNFGAEHVDSPRGIMATVLTSPLPSSFASPSLTQMRNYIQSIPQGSFCLDSIAVRAPKAPSVSLTTRLQSTSFSATVKLSKMQAGCSVRVRAATKSSKAKVGTVIGSSTPSSRTILFSSGALGGAPGKTVYVVAQHRCPGLSSSYSPVRKVVVNRGTLTAASYIKRLKGTLVESIS
jgi:hypothetical protein